MIDCRLVLNVPFAARGDRVLYLDIYLPHEAPGPLPLVIWVPGGGWRNCARGNRTAFLVDHGLATASIEYRVSSQAIAPANVHDCKAAVRWLRAHAAEYGIDPERIGVWGASAGGHLAALLGLAAGVPELEGAGNTDGVSSHVQAVCDFCGPTDLARLVAPPMRQQYPTLYEVTKFYLGGPPEERLDLARLVSPLCHVSADAPPMFIAHGDGDCTVPPVESSDLYHALDEVGADVTLHVVQGGAHGWDWELTNDRVAQFFKRVLP